MACQRIRFMGSYAWLCGKLESDREIVRCAECECRAEKLCDFPIGHDKTCDRALCEKCAVKIRGGIDYCPSHATEYGNILYYQKCEKDGSGI